MRDRRQPPPHHEMQQGDRGGMHERGPGGRGMRPPREMERGQRRGKGQSELSEEDKQF